MHVHKAWGVGSKCVKGCFCMSAAMWKPVLSSALYGFCCTACGDAQTAAVALVDSSVLHCFLSKSLVTKFELLGDGMEVKLASKNQVEASKTCLVPLIVYSPH